MENTDLDAALADVLSARLSANQLLGLWLMGHDVDQELLRVRDEYRDAVARRDVAATSTRLAVVR